MRCQRVAGWFLVVVATAALPAVAIAQVQDPRRERLATVEQWVGISAKDTVEGGTGRLWDLPALRQAATEAMGPALAREALQPTGPETPVTRDGAMLRWSWCRRGDCGGFGYVFVVDPHRGDLFVCRSAESGRQGWMGNDPRMHIPIRGRSCDAANVSEFIRLNTRP
jgi:hypothetical protein